jgi:uncharacterized protein
MNLNPMQALDLDALRSLDGALIDTPELEDRAMGVCTLEGFFTAMVIGPRMVMPSVWMPWVWDRVGGVVHPEFESESALYALLGPVMQFYNQTASAFLSGPEDFKPLFWQMAEDWISEDWCHGFCLGMRLAADDWRPLLTTQPDLFLPFISLGTSAELDTSLSDEQLAEFEDAVVPNLLVIAAHWRASNAFGPGAKAPIRRSEPKPGRNESCPCGSGRKFKKCHGAS